DPDLVDQLVRKTRRLGGRVEVKVEVAAIEESADKLKVKASTGSGQEVFETDLVVHGAGRVPEIDDLNLAAAGIQTEERGVRVNDYLQSISNPAVYAAGDAAATDLPKLTPVAGYEGRIAASNLLKGNHRKMEHLPVPTVVFTNPPLAAVGLTEHAAQQKALRFKVNKQDTATWYASRRVAEDCSGFKVMIEEGTDRVIGAHLIGPHADELINVFALAIQSDIRATKLKHTVFGYPTLSSDVQYMI